MLEDRVKVEQWARLHAFHAAEFGCPAALLQTKGTHLVASDRRRSPGWGGYTVPLCALTTASATVISARSDMVDRINRELGLGQPRGPLDIAELDVLRRISQRVVPHAHSLNGYVMFADQDAFRPMVSRATRIESSDPAGADLRRRFDGPIFAIRNTRGDVVSWAALKLKSDDIWEIAVVTEAAYRGQGLAREVVSAATAYIIEQGRLALYVHDRANLASAKVCRSLGYVEYGQEFFSEY